MQPRGEAGTATWKASVKELTWDPAWEIGFHVIDDQHHEILARIGGIESSIHEGLHRTACDNRLQLLAEYMSIRFECEEGLMKGTSDPGHPGAPGGP